MYIYIYKTKISMSGSEIRIFTSSNIESYFRNLKTKSHRLRIIEFITKHFEYISGEIRLASSDLHLGKDNKTKSIIKRAQSKIAKNNSYTDSIFDRNPSLEKEERSSQ